MAALKCSTCKQVKPEDAFTKSRRGRECKLCHAQDERRRRCKKIGREPGVYWDHLSIPERIERQIERIPEAGCWIWMGNTTASGYGSLTRNRVRMVAHRASWEAFRGPIPAGMFACHRCDVRCCVNPDHLFIGTARDNSMDMHNKGRWNHPGQRTKRTQRDAIMALSEAGGRVRDIALCSGLSVELICTIIKTRRTL